MVKSILEDAVAGIEDDVSSWRFLSDEAKSYSGVQGAYLSALLKVFGVEDSPAYFTKACNRPSMRVVKNMRYALEYYGDLQRALTLGHAAVYNSAMFKLSALCIVHGYTDIRKSMVGVSAKSIRLWVSSARKASNTHGVLDKIFKLYESMMASQEFRMALCGEVHKYFYTAIKPYTVNK